MKAVLQYVLRTLMKDKTGIVQTMPKKEMVDFNVAMTTERLMSNGFDPNAFKNADQVENAIKQIEAPRVDVISQGDPRFEGIMNQLIGKKGEVFDMQGNKIDPKSKIMGGKQSETEAEILARIKEENKKGIEGLKQKMAKEKARTQRISGNLRANNMQRTEIGEPKEGVDYDYYKEILGEDPEYEYYPVKGDETEEFLEAMVKEQKAEMAYMKRLYDKGALDPEKKAQGGRAGFFMGSKFPKGLSTLREMVKLFSKGKDKERSGSEILRLVNPKQFNKLLEDPNIYRKFNIQKGIGAPDLIKNMQADVAKNRTMMVEEILGAAKKIRKADIGTMERKKEMIEEMMRRGIDRETAEDMANTLAKMAEGAAGKFDTPKLTDEGILELENILKNMETGGKKARDLNADGGRIGFKDGMSRRTFLKIFSGLVSLPIIGKVFAPLKLTKGVKNVPVIKTENVAGKPEWFDQLVNKVIVEGDDVTKKFATGERQSIHQKTLDDGSVVRVTEDVDQGVVRVEYESEANVFGDPVQMDYKKPLPDEGDPRPSAEFTTAESGPVGRQQGPDDYDIEIDEVGGTSIRDLDSDVSKLKEYATGQKPTMKELLQNIERRKKAQRITEDPEAQTDAVIRRQGEMLDVDPDPDFASGGIARMLGE